MRISDATLYELNIPFIETFSHSAKARGSSDSFAVKLVSDEGVIGYGEGVARPYVTGETVEASIDHIKNVLWPAVRESPLPIIQPGKDPLSSLSPIIDLLPETSSTTVVAWNGARTAMELALIDCLLRAQQQSLGAFLPPKRPSVTYSGVITSSSTEKAVQHAKHFKLFGLRQIKIKIGDDGDLQRVSAVRESVGPELSIRLDANGAYSIDQAIAVLAKLTPYRIDSVEQPIPRGDPADLARVKRNSSIPIMVDESLVTLDDAKKLIDANACDFFNLRISKCGGLAKTLQIAQIAGAAGIRLQLGCQVGETAILSAAGRHLAAHLDPIDFVEGSYGGLLLTEDISREPVQFGHGGRAPVLRGKGLGVEILNQRLEHYATKVTRL